MCLQNKSSKKSLQILPKSIVINIPFGAMYHTYVALLCINVGMHVIWNVPHNKLLLTDNYNVYYESKTMLKKNKRLF